MENKSNFKVKIRKRYLLYQLCFLIMPIILFWFMFHTFKHNNSLSFKMIFGVIFLSSGCILYSRYFLSFLFNGYYLEINDTYINYYFAKKLTKIPWNDITEINFRENRKLLSNYYAYEKYVNDMACNVMTIKCKDNRYYECIYFLKDRGSNVPRTTSFSDRKFKSKLQSFLDERIYLGHIKFNF